jgi:hypothetical protein
MRTTLSCLSLLLLFAAGCGRNLYFSDDEGGPRYSRSWRGEHPDELSRPYVLGTRVRITVRGTDEPMDDWQVRSDAPAVFSIDKLGLEERRLVAECSALGEGQATLRLYDGAGTERHSATVTIRSPDRARLYAHGPLRILGREESSLEMTEVREARVLTGSKGVYAVTYHLGAQRLYGRGVLRTEGPAEVKAENHTTQGVVANEWLFIHPAADGSHELRLLHRDRQLLTVPVIAVPAAQATALALQEERVGRKEDDQEIWVLAQARDSMGRDIAGLYCDWTLDGVPQMGKDDKAMERRGDLYRYTYRSDAARRQLAVSCGALTGSLSIQASKGHVANTTYLGCSTGLGRGAGPAPVLIILGLLLAGGRLLSQRRRPAGGAATAPAAG